MATTTNTPTSIYLDTFTTKKVCNEDEKMVREKCKPEPEHSEDDKKKGKPKPKKKGLAGRLASAAEVFDDAGKLANRYKRDASKTAFDGNAWMDDHCTGMWFSPIDTASPEFEKNLQSMMEKLQQNRLKTLIDGFQDLAEIAISKAGPVAQEIATNFMLKTGAKVVAGVVLGETIVAPVVMGMWTIHDLFSTAKKLAALAGGPGQAALEALNQIKNIEEKAKDILNSYKTEPHRAHADAMAVMAQLDSCLRARKCLLIPYKNAASDGTKDEEETAKKKENYQKETNHDTPAEREKKLKNMRVVTSKSKSQAKHGLGCCPGQTGHHILPDAMVKNANCPGYKYKEAPTMCLEGAKNAPTHGSHGLAHSNLTKAMATYKAESGPTISYKDAKKHAIDAVHKAGAIQCSRACLEAQLDAHYNCAGLELDPNAGGGGGTKADDGEGNAPVN